MEPFAELVSGIRRINPPSIPYLSNLTGGWILPGEATDPGYWAQHLRRTVRFADALLELLADPGDLLLEVGPGRTLTTLARRHPRSGAVQWAIPSLPVPHDPGTAERVTLEALGRLWLGGVSVSWSQFYGNERRQRVRSRRPIPSSAGPTG